ncbi:MAG: AAA family ATPase [Pseudonocardia sp.]
MTSITLRPTYWLWTSRIPAGAIVLGRGGRGSGSRCSAPGSPRGSRSASWTASTTATPARSSTPPPRLVERTIAGRLIAAAADMSRMFRVDVHHTSPAGAVVLPLSLPRDCDALTDAITAHDVALLVLDPLISVVDSRINVNQEELRTAHEPLAALADRTGAAVFGLAHLSKAGGTDVLSRITGSRAFAAVARAAIAFARDTGAETDRA